MRFRGGIWVNRGIDIPRVAACGEFCLSRVCLERLADGTTGQDFSEFLVTNFSIAGAVNLRSLFIHHSLSFYPIQFCLNASDVGVIATDILQK